MTSLRWKINRLRAMERREVAHRAGRWVAQQVQARRVAAGKTPLPEITVGPGLALFPPHSELTPAWQACYRLDKSGLHELLHGHIRFFGHEALDVGNPVHWSRCPLTGIIAPQTFGKSLDYRDDRLVGNVKFLWELGRHQHLVPLATAYAITGQEEYAEAAVAQIESWITDNPFGLGIHWCSSLEVALRLISWALVHGLLAARDGCKGMFARARDREALGRSIYQQTGFIRGFLSRYSSANNHLIGELTGLLTACRVFDLGDTGQRWAAFAHQELEQESGRQISSDGVDREQALYYHLSVLESLLFAWILEQRADNPFSEPYTRRLTAMVHFLRDIRPAGGQPPQIGGADDGMVARFEPGWPTDPYAGVVAAASAVLAMPVDSSATQKAFWYQAMTGAVAPAAPPPEHVSQPYPRTYTDGGYAILGGGALHLVFDAGPLGYPSIAAHGHADALSLCLAVNGHWWLVDPGTYVYHSEPAWRNYFRGTSAHNTLRVDGRDQSTIGGPFLWVRRAHAKLECCETLLDGSQLAEGWHDGYRSLGVIHRRRLLCAPADGAIELIDTLEGQGSHLCELFFHFAPELDVALNDEGHEAIVSSGDSGTTLRFKLAVGWQWQVVSGQVDPPLGWFSPALERKQPAPVLVGRAQLQVPATVITRLWVS